MREERDQDYLEGFWLKHLGERWCSLQRWKTWGGAGAGNRMLGSDWDGESSIPFGTRWLLDVKLAVEYSSLKFLREVWLGRYK